MRKKTTGHKKRYVQPDDICRFNVITSAAISPDETKVAYTIEKVSDDKKKYFSRLHVADCRTGESVQYTFGEINDRQPVWSPDGSKIAFTSTRDKKTAIYIIPTEGGAEKKIIEEDGVYMNLSWMPNGRELVYCFRYNDSHKEKDEKKKKEPPLYRHITRIFYRMDGEGFVSKDRFHIWKVNIETGKARQLTKGKYDDFLPGVSPDGRKIVFCSNRSPNADINRMLIDIYVISSNGGKEKKIRTPAGPAWAPAFSPDGKKITYIGHDNPADDWMVTNFHVWTVGAGGRPAAKDLTPKLDRTALDSTIGDIGEGLDFPTPCWSADGKRIYFVSSDTGSTHVFYVPAGGGTPTRVTRRKCHIRKMSLNGKKKTVAAVYSDLNTPSELHLVPAVYNGDKRSKKLVSPNKELLSEITLPGIREVWFRAHDGFELQGWLVTPPNFNRNRKYPAVLEIHGGPRVQYGFSFFHEMNLLASNGYVVFYTNPRGGGGRGETFAAAIHGGWGEIDYMDCMAAADYLESRPFVNKKRIGVTGGSYGGYMTNWIVGHTDRFRAAVTQRSVVNLGSFFGSGDLGYSLFREFNGTPWKNPENYKKCSPLTYASNIKTPLLIIHSEKDLRCNIAQAEEFFTTLKFMRKKVEFVRFPEESHGLSRHGRPDRRLARLEWILKWFNRYLK
jgi:dipeptidyl aminopeptidase/acylaminoacyl peptidase